MNFFKSVGIERKFLDHVAYLERRFVNEVKYLRRAERNINYLNHFRRTELNNQRIEEQNRNDSQIFAIRQFNEPVDHDQNK